MHLLATSSTALDDLVEAVDLGQPPGDVAILSFADSDLAGLAAAWAMERDALPSVRLAHLRDLRHPMSVDLWIERVAAHAKVILVRLLGGRSEEHTSELQSPCNLVCRLLLEKKKKNISKQLIRKEKEKRTKKIL